MEGAVEHRHGRPTLGGQAMSDPITIENCDATWRQRFTEETQRVKSMVDNVQIEHHGSTVVPGLPAKPDIDMIVLVAVKPGGAKR